MPKIAYHSSRAAFVSGQAQHGFNFGFSFSPETASFGFSGSGGVADCDVPILLADYSVTYETRARSTTGSDKVKVVLFTNSAILEMAEAEKDQVSSLCYFYLEMLIHVRVFNCYGDPKYKCPWFFYLNNKSQRKFDSESIRSNLSLFMGTSSYPI